MYLAQSSNIEVALVAQLAPYRSECRLRMPVAQDQASRWSHAFAPSHFSIRTPS
jgi:hypothetical protein